METLELIKEIIAERTRQDYLWGEQNHPILDQALIGRKPSRMCEEYEIPSESRAKMMYNISVQEKNTTYMHILIEEVSEAASCGSNITELRKELIQVAAVAIAMIESLDRNGK